MTEKTCLGIHRAFACFLPCDKIDKTKKELVSYAIGDAVEAHGLPLTIELTATETKDCEGVTIEVFAHAFEVGS